MINELKLTTGDVARELDLSVDRIRQLDSELQPARTARGLRIYDRDRVLALKAERDRAKSECR